MYVDESCKCSKPIKIQKKQPYVFDYLKNITNYQKALSNVIPNKS